MAAAIGSFVLGAFTTVAEASPDVKEWLDFRAPVGPLSGKTTMAVAAWAVSWLILAAAWRRKDLNFRPVVIAAAVLLVLGLVGTFPTFFESFTTE
jgi:fluoride ion exporter CrcB/FEX